MLGILWPIDVYKRIEKTSPPSNLITTVTHNNKPVRGVVHEP